MIRDLYNLRKAAGRSSMAVISTLLIMTCKGIAADEESSEKNITLSEALIWFGGNIPCVLQDKTIANNGHRVLTCRPDETRRYQLTYRDPILLLSCVVIMASLAFYAALRLHRQHNTTVQSVGGGQHGTERRAGYSSLDMNSLNLEMVTVNGGALAPSEVRL